MSWVEPEFSRRQIDRAGQLLVANIDVPRHARSDDYHRALKVINNWRSSHGFPLHAMKTTLSSRARKIRGDAIVAQRLKRLNATAAKLGRYRSMQLSRMQDIGGCRAILGDIADVAQLIEVYLKGIQKNPQRSELVRRYDYISEPKPDGYRSYHLVFRYRSSSPRYQRYDGLCIEIQARSALQHAWATAVETVSTFTGQDLKSNIGDDSWKRFFALMGTVIARHEKAAPVAGTPARPKALKDELVALARETRVREVLSGWRRALEVIGPRRSAAQYLLTLDPRQKQVEILAYDRRHTSEVAEAYLRAEREAHASDRQAVLVSTDSLAALKSAYPNYYLDTTAFLDVVERAIA